MSMNSSLTTEYNNL